MVPGAMPNSSGANNQFIDLIKELEKDVRFKKIDDALKHQDISLTDVTDTHSGCLERLERQVAKARGITYEEYQSKLLDMYRERAANNLKGLPFDEEKLLKFSNFPKKYLDEIGMTKELDDATKESIIKHGFIDDPVGTEAPPENDFNVEAVRDSLKEMED